MKKLLFLLVLLFFPFKINALESPHIKELIIEDEKIELISNVFSYDAVMTRDAYKAKIEVVLDEGLTYEIDGDTGIKIGLNDIVITVFNESGQSQAYTIQLTKKAPDAIVLSGNNRLESLNIDGVVFDFDT